MANLLANTTLLAGGESLSGSIYFCDPYGNRLEVTTYDYAYVSEQTTKVSQTFVV